MTDLLLFVGVAVVVTCALALLVVWLADTDRLRTSLRCEECHAPVTVRDDTDRAAWVRCGAAGVVRCTQHAPASLRRTCVATGPYGGHHYGRPLTDSEGQTWRVCHRCGDTVHVARSAP